MRTDFGAHRRLTCLLSTLLTSHYRPENQFRNTARGDAVASDDPELTDYVVGVDWMDTSA